MAISVRVQRLLLSAATVIVLLLTQRVEPAASCPAICSTPTVYGFTVTSTALCECKPAADSSTIAPSEETGCMCRECYVQQSDKVVTYTFLSDGTCPFRGVDCSVNCELSSSTSSQDSSSSDDARSLAPDTIKMPKSPATTQPTAAPASTPSPAPTTLITATSASKSSGWSSLATGMVFFLCVLGLGVALIAVVKLYRKNQLQNGDQDDDIGKDNAYRLSSNDSEHFRDQGRVSEVVIPDAHLEGEDPSQTYEVLVFGIDSTDGDHQQR